MLALPSGPAKFLGAGGQAARANSFLVGIPVFLRQVMRDALVAVDAGLSVRLAFMCFW
jgi:hypothetical protein